MIKAFVASLAINFFYWHIILQHPHTPFAMHSHVQAPRPVRPLKHSLTDIDPDCSSPSDKRAQLFTPPILLPSPARSDVSPSRKRALEEFDSDSAPVKKYRRLSPSPTTIDNWVTEVSRSGDGPVPPLDPRPSSAPAEYSSLKQLAPVEDFKKYTISLAALNQMSLPDSHRPGSAASSQSGRPSTSSPLYRSLIRRNNIIFDPSGIRMSSEVQELLDTHILKRRDSPPLTDAEVFEVVKKAEDLMDYAEGRASDIVGTKAFPVERRGVSEGRYVQWTTDPLPKNPNYPHQLSAPKPDRHYGYPLGHKSEWTDAEMAVVDHRAAQSYTQPTRENLFPFYMLEVKAEPTGGVLYVAENQAVGSGVHSVESLRWLLAEAYPSKVFKVTDAVSFASAVTPRAAVFYVCWYSEEDQCHFVSKFKNVCFMEGPKRPDIQDCRNVTKNIIDYGLGDRQAAIRKALAELKSIPPHWKKSRPSSSIAETSTTSYSVNESRSNRSRKG